MSLHFPVPDRRQMPLANVDTHCFAPSPRTYYTGCFFFLLLTSVTWSHVLHIGGVLLTKSCLSLATPWTVAHQAPLSMGFPRQEYGSGLPLPSRGDRPNPGIEPGSPAQ